MGEYPVTNRNKVKRVPKRAHYDQTTVYRILDSAFVCHLGFVVEGQPFVIPTAYGRKGNAIYVHGATKSRMLVNIEKGIPVCATVTHVDGIVLARSAFHHSMNYRSVMVYGTARLVPSEEAEEALKVISDHIIPERWEECRPTKAIELKATSVLKIEIESASAKIRTGPPVDDEEDYDLPIWAGVLPLNTTIGEVEVDSAMRMEVNIPESVKNFNPKRFD